MGGCMFAQAGAGENSTPEQGPAAIGIIYRKNMPSSQEAAYEKFNQ